MSKIISILGSTGSIGLSSLSIIEKKKKYFRLNVFQQTKIINKFVNKLLNTNQNFS